MIRRVAIKIGFIAAILVALSAPDAAARTIRIAWEASPDATVTGYRVYWSTQPGVYNATDYFEAGNSLTWVGDLPGDQYFFVVRSYDATGELGDPSLEVGDTSAFWLSNPGDQSSASGDAVDLLLVAHGASVTYTADGLPGGLSLDPVSGQILGTITAPSIIQVVTARATDAVGHVSSVQFYWSVHANQAPEVTSPGDQTTLIGAAVSLPLGAHDPEGHTLAYSAANLPPGVTIDPITGTMAGTPTASGLFNVTVSVSDGFLATGIAFAWQVWSGDTLIVERAVSAFAIGSTVSTEPLSTTFADETLVAFVEAAQPSEIGAQTATVSGAGLSWTLVARANGQAGTAEIWTAHASAPLSNVTVTADTTITGTFLSVTVVSFAGADGVGASATASAPGGAPAVSLTTTRAGSFVFGGGNDWDGAVPRTAAAGQDLLQQWLGDAGDTFWVQRLGGAVAGAGTAVTLMDTDPTNHRWNFAAVEIRLRSLSSVPTVVLTPTIAAPGGSLYAAIGGAPGHPGDWAGLFSLDGGAADVLARQDVNGSAQLVFQAPSTPGVYNVRLFSAADAATPIAVSNAVVVMSSLSIDNASAREGDSGSASMIFTVTLSAPSTVPVSVDYATADGTAKAGSDYAAQSGTLLFPAGTTTRTIAVAVFGDKADEADETFTLVLSHASNALIAQASGIGTIQNDDETAKAESQMFGFGAMTDGRLRDRFVFRAAERKAADYARLEFWSAEPVKGKGIDDDDRPGHLDGDYGHDHRAAKNRFESTRITSVTFGPRDRNGQSVTFAGAGSWNGKAGYTFEARATDAGEPGRGRDTFALVVKDSRGTVVLSVAATIEEGNIQSSGPAKR
jgi:hypothetical protein